MIRDTADKGGIMKIEKQPGQHKMNHIVPNANEMQWKEKIEMVEKVNMLRDIKSRINKMYVLWNQYKINLVEVLCDHGGNLIGSTTNNQILPRPEKWKASSGYRLGEKEREREKK